MMNYKIVEYFGPDVGSAWTEYLAWIKLNLSCFDSIDAILRRDLFTARSDEDWEHCLNDDPTILTDLDYALTVLKTCGQKALLVGVSLCVDSFSGPATGLLGFDIIDGSVSGISLLTNWGADIRGTSLNTHIASNGLILDGPEALRIRDLLRKKFPDDPHASRCQVWGVYRVPQEPQDGSQL